MAEHGFETPDASRRPREFGSARGLTLIHMPDDFAAPLFDEPALADRNREEENTAWAHLQQAGQGTLSPMLQQAIRAATALSDEDQDALAAAMLKWIEDERRWAESFARTHEALQELARETLAEHYPSQTLDAVEWLDASLSTGVRLHQRPPSNAELLSVECLNVSDMVVVDVHRHLSSTEIGNE